MPCRTTCGPKSSVTVWCRGQKPTYCDTYQEAELMIYGSPHLERRCMVEQGCVPQVVFADLGRRRRRQPARPFEPSDEERACAERCRAKGHGSGQLSFKTGILECRCLRRATRRHRGRW